MERFSFLILTFTLVPPGSWATMTDIRESLKALRCGPQSSSITCSQRWGCSLQNNSIISFPNGELIGGRNSLNPNHSKRYSASISANNLKNQLWWETEYTGASPKEKLIFWFYCHSSTIVNSKNTNKDIYWKCWIEIESCKQHCCSLTKYLESLIMLTKVLCWK